MPALRSGPLSYTFLYKIKGSAGGDLEKVRFSLRPTLQKTLVFLVFLAKPMRIHGNPLKCIKKYKKVKKVKKSKKSKKSKKVSPRDPDYKKSTCFNLSS